MTKSGKRALIVIFTDMFSNGDTEELFSALQHLCYNKHEVILFHVKDKRMEEAFEFSNRPPSLYRSGKRPGNQIFSK